MIATVARRALAGALTLGLTAALVSASRVWYRMPGGDAAVLRLSWSGRPERIETCRRLSHEELEQLPAHMRQEVQCEGHAARYLVRATDGATLLVADTVTGGGVRGDRAIHMIRDLALPPGARTLSVEIRRIDAVTETADSAEPGHEGDELWRPGAEDRERREEEERRRQRLDRLPPELRWEGQVTLGAGEVVLVSYDPAARHLVARMGQ